MTKLYFSIISEAQNSDSEAMLELQTYNLHSNVTNFQGPSYVRFKAEIFFNSEVITKKYLETLDTSTLLQVFEGT